MCHLNLFLATSGTYPTCWEMPTKILPALMALYYFIMFGCHGLSIAWEGLADITKSGWFKKLWFQFQLQMDGASWESKCRREELEEKIQLHSIFRSPFLDQFYIICIWTVGLINSDICSLIRYLRANLIFFFFYNLNLNHRWEAFVYYFLKTVTWMNLKGIMPSEERLCTVCFHFYNTLRHNENDREQISSSKGLGQQGGLTTRGSQASFLGVL